jgi:hypothetical protein
VLARTFGTRDGSLASECARRHRHVDSRNCVAHESKQRLGPPNPGAVSNARVLQAVAEVLAQHARRAAS